MQAWINLRAAATPGPLSLVCIPGHGSEDDSWLIPDAVRGRYGDNALNFEIDEATGRFIEAAFNELPKIGAELLEAHGALERIEALTARSAVPGSELAAAIADLRTILAPAARSGQEASRDGKAFNPAEVSRHA